LLISGSRGTACRTHGPSAGLVPLAGTHNSTDARNALLPPRLRRRPAYCLKKRARPVGVL